MARTTLLNGHGHGHGRSERLHEADRQDTAGAAEARVSLKMAAERYSASRYGADAGGRLTAAALFTLRARALHYYGQLHPAIDLRKKISADLRDLHGDPVVDQAFACLQAAALAYSNTRVGADASLEFTRAAIGDLCNEAIAYAEALLSTAEAASYSRTRDERSISLLSGDLLVSAEET